MRKKLPVTDPPAAEPSVASRSYRPRLPRGARILLACPLRPRDLVPALVMGVYLLGVCLKKVGFSPTKFPALFMCGLVVILAYAVMQALPKAVQHRLAKNPWLGFLQADGQAKALNAQPSPFPDPIPFSEPKKRADAGASRTRVVSRSSADPFDQLRFDILARIAARRLYRPSIVTAPVSAHFSRTIAGRANLATEQKPEDGSRLSTDG